jgi:hypothetical protein
MKRRNKAAFDAKSFLAKADKGRTLADYQRDHKVFSFFMNRFRKLGFVQYESKDSAGLNVHSSLLNIILHD